MSHNARPNSALVIPTTRNGRVPSAAARLPSLKDYVFTEKLGSGSYASVYKAFKKAGDREIVAVKCVLKKSLNKTSTENLLTEIELLKLLKHKHIVQLKDIDWDSHYIYLIMEYCSGGDLMKCLRRKHALHERTAQRFLQQIASALQYMREMNVAHLDLKPQNILISSTNPPCLKIADFGFAHYLVGDVETAYLKGSPLYMAPEIVKTKVYDAKADLWSVGIILYECLFGQTPFSSSSIEELAEKIISDLEIKIPPPGFTISDRCRDLLVRLLQRDPSARITFEEFFNHPFIELDRYPTEKSLQNATDLVSKAIKLDSERKFSEAIEVYVKALDFFIGSLHYESDEEKKNVIRKKSEEYINRVELLQEKITHDYTDSNKNIKTNYLQELDQLAVGHAQLPLLLQSQKKAFQLEEEEKFEPSLVKQEKIIRQLLDVLQAQQDDQSRLSVLLREHISKSLTHAELLKNYTAALKSAEKRRNKSAIQSVRETCHIQ